MQIQIQLPSMVASVLGRDRLSVEAETLAGAMRAAYALAPALEPLLCDESGAFREHVLCLLQTSEGTLNSRWLEDLERPLEAGQSIVIMQAVSGG